MKKRVEGKMDREREGGVRSVEEEGERERSRKRKRK